jgi:hypothetical protein
LTLAVPVMQFRNMARPTLFDRPLTAAERMRLHRARKAAGAGKTRKTVRQLCQLHGVSERSFYYVQAFQRDSLIDWSDGVTCFASMGKEGMALLAKVWPAITFLGGTHGKASMEFLAEVCRYGDAAAQIAVRDCIKQSGAAAGKALWRQLMPKHPDLERKLKLAEERKRDRRLGRRRRRMNPHLGMVF